MTSIRIIYRPSRSKSNEKGTLSLRVLHLRKHKLISTGLSLCVEEWDEPNQQVILQSNNPERQAVLRQIAAKLELQIQQIQLVFDKLSKKGGYTVDNILSQYKLRAKKNSLCQFVDLLSKELTKQGQERTARAYLSVRKRFVRFNKEKDISLDHLNGLIVHQFEKKLKDDNLKLNSISFYMRNLRAIYNKAIAHGQIVGKSVNPFATVFTGLAPTSKRALTVEEFTLIKDLDFNYLFEKEEIKNNNLSQAKDLFLFSFHARGMSFVDIAYLKKENIQGGVISYNRKKTGQQLNIAITKSLQKILDRYKAVTKDSEYVFPIITNVKKSAYRQYLQGLTEQNKQLKKIAKLSGVKKKLSTHMARHTWATIAKEQNLPLWVISESLGHSSVKTTYIYLASFNRSVLDEANERVSLAVGF